MSTTKRKMSIHINEDSIQIETNQNGRTSFKNTTLRGVQEVLTRGERIETPLLPSVWGVQKYIKVNNRELYAISTPPSIREVSYDFRADGNREATKFKIPLPGFLWIFILDVNPNNDTRRYNHGMVYAVKNQILSENDRMFKFPFSNVDDSWMCWGDGNNYPTLGNSKSVMTISDRFLANPFNNHLDHDKYRRFEAEVKGQKIQLFKTSHLFDYLAKEQAKAEAEGKNATFKYDCLREQTTLGEAIRSYTDRFLR